MAKIFQRKPSDDDDDDGGLTMEKILEAAKGMSSVKVALQTSPNSVAYGSSSNVPSGAANSIAIGANSTYSNPVQLTSGSISIGTAPSPGAGVTFWPNSSGSLTIQTPSQPLAIAFDLCPKCGALTNSADPESSARHLLWHDQMDDVVAIMKDPKLRQRLLDVLQEDLRTLLEEVS